MTLEGTFFDVRGLEQPVELASSSTGARRYRKQLIYEGELLKRQPGKSDQVIKVPGSRIDHWAFAMKDFIRDGVEIPMPKGHTDDPELKRAEIVDVEVALDGKGRKSLYGVYTFTSPEAEQSLRSSDVSVYSPPTYTNPVTKKQYDWPIRHVAFTNYPVVPGLEKAQAIAMSFEAVELGEQPRDERGRFGSGGGGSSKGPPPGHPSYEGPDPEDEGPHGGAPVVSGGSKGKTSEKSTGKSRGTPPGVTEEKVNKLLESHPWLNRQPIGLLMNALGNSGDEQAVQRVADRYKLPFEKVKAVWDDLYLSFDDIALAGDQPRDERGRFGSGGGGSSAKSGMPTEKGGKADSGYTGKSSGLGRKELAAASVKLKSVTSMSRKQLAEKLGVKSLPHSHLSKEVAHQEAFAKEMGVSVGKAVDIISDILDAQDDGVELSFEEEQEPISMAGFPPAAPAAPAPAAAPPPGAPAPAPAQGPAKVPTLRDIATKLGVPATIPEEQLLVQIDAKVTALMAPKPAAPVAPVPGAPPMAAAPAPRPIAASLVTMAKKSRDQDLTNLVKEGRITTAVAEGLRKQYCGEEAIKLSLDDDAPNDGFDSLVASLSLNEPRKVGEKTGVQSQTDAKTNPLLKDAQNRADESKK